MSIKKIYKMFDISLCYLWCALDELIFSYPFKQKQILKIIINLQALVLFAKTYLCGLGDFKGKYS